METQTTTHAVWDGVALLRVTGDVDIACSAEVRERGEQLVDTNVHTLRVDLSRVEFLDASGIGALVAIRNKAQAANCAMIIIEPASPVLRVLEIAGMNDVFGIYQNQAVSA